MRPGLILTYVIFQYLIPKLGTESERAETDKRVRPGADRILSGRLPGLRFHAVERLNYLICFR